MSTSDSDMVRGMIRDYIKRSYHQHLHGNREQLIQACVQHVVESKNCPVGMSTRIAIQEIAHYENLCLGAELDIDRSNSSLVVIHNRRQGTRHYFTVEDVLSTASALTVRAITR